MKLIVSAIILLLILFHGEIVAREQHIYLSRHAEKIKGISDPGLTEKGKNRAQWLSDFLKSKSVEVIYSTNYKRTLQTAQPVASVLKKDIIIYHPHHQEQLARRLLTDSRNSFISGHSNTLPELVKLLGGNPGVPMTERQYDRLYHLRVDDRGKVTTNEIKSLP